MYGTFGGCKGSNVLDPILRNMVSVEFSVTVRVDNVRTILITCNNTLTSLTEHVFIRNNYIKIMQKK